MPTAEKLTAAIISAISAPIPAITAAAIAEAVAAAAAHTLAPTTTAVERALVIADHFADLIEAGAITTNSRATMQALGAEAGDWQHIYTDWVIRDVVESPDPAHYWTPTSWTGTIPGIGNVRCSLFMNTFEARLIDTTTYADDIRAELDQLTAEDALTDASMSRCCALMAETLATLSLDIPDAIAALTVAIDRIARPATPDDWSFAGYVGNGDEDYQPSPATLALASALVPLIELRP